MPHAWLPTVPSRVDQNMTPMIDIVFHLLAFFVMTFQLAQVEGDFSIKLPLAVKRAPLVMAEVIQVRMEASPNGQLYRLQLGARELPSFDQLHDEIVQIVDTDTGPGSMASQLEVELDCDDALHYENVIRAITAVSGHIRNGKTYRLIEHVRFAAPRRLGESTRD